MLINNCRFAAYFLISTILLFLGNTLPSYASMDEDEEFLALQTPPLFEQHLESHPDLPSKRVTASSSEIPLLAGEKSKKNGNSSSSHAKKRKKTPEKPNEIFELIPGKYFQSSMVFYDPNASPVSQTFQWDNQKEFMAEIDKHIFDLVRSKPSIAVEIVGFIMGAVSPFPATGAVNKSIGKFFGNPPGQGLSTTISVLTVLTTLPSFGTNLGEKFSIIFDVLSKRKSFPTRSNENSSKPCAIKISKLHKVAIGVLAVGSFLDAFGNLGVIESAYYEHFQNVFYGIGWAYFLSWMERYYTIGRAHIDRLFCRYADSDISQDQRRLLINSLKKCRQAIAQSDSFTNELYQKILEEINRENSAIQNLEEENPSHLFALSALFLQSASTMSYEPDEETSLIATTRSFNYQISKDLPIDWKEEFLEKLSLILAAAGSIGRVVTMEYLIEQVLTQVFHVSAPTANIISWVFSSLDVLFKTFAERDSQQQYMKGWLNSFSVEYLGDFQWLRKITGWTSIINGGLFSLAKSVAGISCLKAWGAPLPLQILLLVPAFIQDQAYYGAIFDEGKNKFITKAATLKKPTENTYTSIKRAWLIKWIEKIEYPLTCQWDSETIGNLSELILKAI